MVGGAGGRGVNGLREVVRRGYGGGVGIIR